MLGEPSTIDLVARAIQRVNEETTGLRYTELTREMARAAIEVMRSIPEREYDRHRCDKLWRDLNSTEVLNLWIDAALSEGEG